MSTGCTPIIGVAGCGVTGSRVVAHLAAAAVRVAAYDQVTAAATAMARRHGAVAVDRLVDLAACDLVVLATPSPHLRVASVFLDERVPLVTLGDDVDDLRGMLALGSAAKAGGVTAVVGAGMAPGLSGLLARYLADQVPVLDELHVATHGTAGPACARQHHHALGHTALGWHDGEWIEPPGGTGRDLVWFPEPIEARDCYRAAVADPLLLHRSFPGVMRIAARVSASRRDRLTARLPMLTPPHASGDLGAVRVEARGADHDGARVTLIAGAAGVTADLAAAVCAATALRVIADGAEPGVHSLSDSTVEHLDVLHHATTFGVRVQEFTGVARATHW